MLYMYIHMYYMFASIYYKKPNCLVACCLSPDFFKQGATTLSLRVPRLSAKRQTVISNFPNKFSSDRLKLTFSIAAYKDFTAITFDFVDSTGSYIHTNANAPAC